MSVSVPIDFACNDPDNGLFAGRIEGVQIYYRCGDPLIELEPRTTRAPLLTRLEDDRLRISGKSWPIVGSKEWFGNWCWNRWKGGLQAFRGLLLAQLAETA